MNCLIFDIETIPDIESGKKLYNLETLNDEDCVSAMAAIRREKVGHDFHPLHLQQIVAISIVFAYQDQIKVWSVGDEKANEKEIIERFFNGISQYTPTIISWNGSGFDLPVLHYRSLLHGVAAPDYWEVGENLKEFKWNNYLNRYHYRHLDLMDVLACYNGRANAPLDEIATMLGFPGKMGMSGAKVWQQYHGGNIKAIRDYCETDVLNTYCVYLRFELIRGNLSEQDYHRLLTRLHDYLEQQQKPHFDEFLQHWNYACPI